MSSYQLSETAENLWAETVTIASGANVSDGVSTQGHALVGGVMPGAWTAAKIGFDVSLDNITYQTAYDAGGNVEQATVAAATSVAFPTSDALFWPFLRVKSVD